MIRKSLLIAAATCLIAGAAHADMVKFHSDLSGDAEALVKPTEGNGTADATLDTSTKTLNYTLTYSGLTGPATAAHFHGPAAVGANAGVALPIAAPLASPIKGSAILTDAQVADLEAGKYYANIHTAANAGGEIRGQMMKAN